MSWSRLPAMQHKSIIAMYLLQTNKKTVTAHIVEGLARQNQSASDPKISRKLRAYLLRMLSLGDMQSCFMHTFIISSTSFLDNSFKSRI